MDELTQAVSNVGFPIAVSAYLLTRFEKILADNTKALQDLRAVLGMQIKKEV